MNNYLEILLDTKHLPSIISIIVVIISGFITFLTIKVNNKNQIQFEIRKMKQSMYLDYMSAIGDYGNMGKNRTKEEKDKNTNLFVDAHNKLILIGNSKIIRAMDKFEICMKKNDEEREKGEYSIKLDKLIKALRQDLLAKKMVNIGVGRLYLLTLLESNNENSN